MSDTDSTFYSDRAGKAIPRTIEEVSGDAWRGLVALIRRHLSNGSLARAFPEQHCPDEGGAITGTDEEMFLDSLAGHIPRISHDVLLERQPPDTTTVLDIIDFVALHIDRPSRRSSHSYFRHEHLYFGDHRADDWLGDELTPGQAGLRDDINLIFARNGITFTLNEDMRVHRLGPPEARPLISDFKPATGDPQLDAKLNDAMTRFLSRAPADRQDALEKLWDAFERLKTLELGGQKKDSAAKLLDATAPEPFRTELDAEFKTLTGIGNNFTIRHHEHDKHDLPSDAAFDYVFIRLASLIAFVLRQTGRMGAG
ncbi:hypothetical protein ACGFNU_37230 [Spirillospora sp. NPDC048911]|uniref:hypothetical protein n=1 Tax=Spirillospora sp. NPDC048911 TaxID=3364527 RepID=UPI00371B544E